MVDLECSSGADMKGLAKVTENRLQMRVDEKCVAPKAKPRWIGKTLPRQHFNSSDKASFFNDDERQRDFCPMH